MPYVLQLHFAFEFTYSRLERLDVLRVLGPLHLRVLITGQESKLSLSSPQVRHGFTVLLLQLLLLLGRLAHLLHHNNNNNNRFKLSKAQLINDKQWVHHTHPENMIQAGHLPLELSYVALRLLALTLDRAQRATQRLTFRFKLSNNTDDQQTFFY